MIKYIKDEELGSFYRMNGGQLEWQPMVQGSAFPVKEDWGAVDEELVGSEKVVYQSDTRTLQEVYDDFIKPQFETEEDV